MKLHRIYAILLRNLFTFRRTYDRWFDAFYNPILELLVWGLASSYISHSGAKLSNLTFIILSGISLWIIVYRSQYETNVSLLEETWSRNLINMFVSPLKFSEWIAAVTLIGILKALISFVTAAVVALILYKVHVFAIGIYLVPVILLLFMTGWWTSYLIGGLIFRFGTKVSSFAWTLIFMVSPLSGIYYPISAMPKGVQTLSHALPTSYVFEEIRTIIQQGRFDMHLFLMSLFLNIVYLVLSLFFLRWSYRQLLQKGLLQMF